MKKVKVLDLTKKTLLKQNSNLIEFPLYKTDNRDKRNVFEITTNRGKYTFQSGKNLIPDDKDALFLYFLLFLAQKNNTNEINLTFYEIIKSLNYPLNGKEYKRLELSLEKWLSVFIKFDNCFYQNGVHIKAGFHILNYKISDEVIDKKKIINISLDKDFLKMMRESNFFQEIDLSIYFKLKHPLSRRLYEYLSKAFINQKSFKISTKKLFDKIRIKLSQYPSEIKRKINSIEKALKRVNEFDSKKLYSLIYEQDPQDKTNFILEFTNHKFKKSKELEEKPTKEEIETLQEQEPSKPKKLTEREKFLETLKTDFLQSKKQAQEILSKYEDINILKELLDDIEKRYKNNEIDNLGAYTYKLLAVHNQRFKKSKFDIEKEEKEKVRAEAEQKAKLKKQREELRPKYDDLVKSKALETFETMEEMEQLKVRVAFEVYLENINEKIYQAYQLKGFSDIMARIEFKKFMLDKGYLKVMPFDEYADKILTQNQLWKSKPYPKI